MNSEFNKQYEELEIDNLLKSAGLIAAQLEWKADQARADVAPDPDPERKKLILQLIEKKLEMEEQREKRKKMMRRGIRSTLILTAAISAVLVGLFVTVSAFRVPISNYFFEKYDKYSKLVLDIDGYSIVEKPEGWELEYNPTRLPERFSFLKIKTTNNKSTIQYADEQGGLLFFTIYPVDDQFYIDTENRSEFPVDLNGMPATIYAASDDTKISIVWHNSRYNFYIDGPVSKYEIVQIAKSVQMP